jgi:MFS family permease
MWSIVRDRPLPSYAHHEVLTKKRFYSGLKQVLRSHQTWITAIYSALMYLPTPAFTALWGVPFLMTTYKMTATSAAFSTSMTFLGYAFGSPFFGWLSDRIGKRKPPMLVGTIAALIIITSVIYLHLTMLALTINLFAFGFFSSAWLIAFSIAREINAPWVNATALGFVNMLNSLGGALAQPLIGFFLDLQWSGSMQDNTRLFTVTNFHWALAILPICLFVALLLLPFIKETYCRPVYDIVNLPSQT